LIAKKIYNGLRLRRNITKQKKGKYMKVLTKKNFGIINLVVALKRLLGRFCPTRKMTMVEYIDKYGGKLTHREMMEAADRFGLNEADKFVKHKHPENENAILIGMTRSENTNGIPEALFYINEKTGEIFSEPEFYYEFMKRGQKSA